MAIKIKKTIENADEWELAMQEIEVEETSTEEKQDNRVENSFTEYWEWYSNYVVDPLQLNICKAMKIINYEKEHIFNQYSPDSIMRIIIKGSLNEYFSLLALSIENLAEKIKEEK